jgi:hypothetical protein
MGCGASKEDTAGKVRNDEIENQLKRDKMAQRNEIKMLLLGMQKTSFVSNRKLILQVLVNLASLQFSSR